MRKRKSRGRKLRRLPKARKGENERHKAFGTDKILHEATLLPIPKKVGHLGGR